MKLAKENKSITRTLEGKELEKVQEMRDDLHSEDDICIECAIESEEAGHDVLCVECQREEERAHDAWCDYMDSLFEAKEAEEEAKRRSRLLNPALLTSCMTIDVMTMCLKSSRIMLNAINQVCK